MTALNTYLTTKRQSLYNFIDLPHSNQNITAHKETNPSASIEVLNQLASHIEILNQSALLTITDLKGNIVHANELFCGISKYSLDEVLHHSHHIIRHPDTPIAVFMEIENTVMRGEVWKGELKNKAKDGSDYWVIATIAPISGHDGKPAKHISIEYDITKQKLAEEELKQAKKKIDNELLENLEYAKHIHSSLLGNNEGLELENDSFLIYKAQKIISGDFYKIEQKDNKLMVVVGDSTGHGIAASYISILALNILSRVTRFCGENPGRILKMINHELNRITQHNKEKKLTESADMMVCCIDKEQMTLTYASARMRAFIIRDEKLILLEKDKCSIGAIQNDDFNITTRCIDLKKGDCLYIATDGLSDQLGGVRDRCIGFKYIREMIYKLNGISMSEQKTIIEDTLAKWQGSNEQTDDITVFGIRI
ncbi:MAG: SpoIIE family protein phosphatase [Bacteroidota bacterium]